MRLPNKKQAGTVLFVMLSTVGVSKVDGNSPLG